MNKTIKIILIVVLGLFFIGLVYHFVIHPEKISGADVGTHKVGTIVMTHAKWLKLRALNSGDIIIYTKSNNSSDFIAQVVGIPGDGIPGSATYQSGEKIMGTVPTGFYMIKFPVDGTLGLIAEQQIYYIVW